MDTRRKFLKTAGAFAAGSLILPIGCTSKKGSDASGTVVEDMETITKDVGLQLYTLRNEIAAEGIDPVLEKVAKLGFKWMEGFGYEDRKILKKTPAELKQKLSDVGMSMPSLHSITEVSSSGGKESIIDQMKAAAEDGLAVGAEYLVWAYLVEEERQSMDDYKRHIETWNKFGEVCNEAGIQFIYHNHDFEFFEFDGQRPYDVIMAETDPNNVKFELDLYWITKAGYDPVEYFNKAPGRFPLWHVKDMEDSAERSFAEVGSGTIDFERIFKAREISGMKYFFVEQDQSKRTPFESIEMSINYLNKSDFV